MGRRLTYRRLGVTGRQIDLPLLVYGGWSQSRSADTSAWHEHEGWEIVVVTEGSLNLEFENGHLLDAAHGGQVIVTPPKLVHRGVEKVIAPNTYTWVTFYPHAPRGRRHSPFSADDWKRIVEGFQAAGNCVANGSQKLLTLARWMPEALVQGSRHNSVPEIRPWLRSLFCQLIQETLQCVSVNTEPKENRYVTAAVEFMRAHLNEPIHAKDLQTFLGFSRNRVNDIFKSATGFSPGAYLQRMRIETARQLLLQTDLPVTTIAGRVGFDTSQYFSTVFRKHTGQTATGFRKSHRGTAQPGKREVE